MLNLYHLTIGCTHEGGGVVAVAELLALLAGLVLYPLLTYETLGVHGDECGEAVATVNVEALGYRAEAVSSVYVATVLHVILHAPVEVVLIVVVGIFPVVVPEPLEAVDVGALGADNLTEYAVLSHRKSVHLIVVVAAVLEDEAVETCLLSEVDELPALLEVHS